MSRTRALVLPVVALAVLLHSGPFASARHKDRGRGVQLMYESEPLARIAQALAGVGGGNVIVSPKATGKLALHAKGKPWKDVLEAVAIAVGHHTLEEPTGIIRVAVGPAPASALAKQPAARRVSLSFNKTDIRRVVRDIASYTQANVVMDATLSGSVTMRIHDRPWREALEQAVRAAGHQVVESRGGFLCIVQRAHHGVGTLKSRRVTLAHQDASAADALMSIAKLAGASVVLGPGIDKKVTFDLKDVAWRTAFEFVAAKAGLVVLEETPGILRVQAP